VWQERRKRSIKNDRETELAEAATKKRVKLDGTGYDGTELEKGEDSGRKNKKVQQESEETNKG